VCVLYCAACKQFEVEAASCENETAWAGNTNCIFSVGTGLDTGASHPPPPKAVFF